MKTRSEKREGARRDVAAQPAKLAPFARAVEGGIELWIKVVPGASRSEIAGVLGDRLKVRVAAAAEGGKANRAVVQVLREWLGVRGVQIVSGSSSPEKTVRVAGLTRVPSVGR